MFSQKCEETCFCQLIGKNGKGGCWFVTEEVGIEKLYRFRSILGPGAKGRVLK